MHIINIKIKMECSDLYSDSIIPYWQYERIYELISNNCPNIDKFLYKEIDMAVIDLLLFVKKFLVKEFGEEFFVLQQDIIKKMAKIILDDLIRQHIYKCEKEKSKLKQSRDQWIDEPTEINESHNMVSPTINRLTVQLRDYQRAIVYAMGELERKQKINKIVVNAGCLQSHTGSGKTIMILAHCLLEKYVAPSKKYYYNNGIIIRQDKQYNYNIVLVNSNVFTQWLDEIMTKIENPSVIGINDAADLNKFLRDLPVVEFVIIRNFKVKRQSVLNILGAHLKVVNRLIIDDFDIIKLMPEDGELRAAFYWYVSATISRHITIDPSGSMHVYPRQTFGTSIINKFAIRATNNYVDACNKLPIIKFFKIIVRGNYMSGAINAIAKMEDIAEMINGDAIDEAAARLGIVAASVDDIYRKILMDEYDLYKNACDTIKFINTISFTPQNENVPKDDQYLEVENLIHTKNPIVHTMAGIDAILSNILKINKAKKEKYGNVLEKLWRAQTECQICKFPLCSGDLKIDEDIDEDIKGIIILTCCGAMFCNNCGVKGCDFKRSGGNIKGTCPNCLLSIKPSCMIFLGVAQQLSDEVIEPIEQPKYCKLPYLLTIINGILPAEAQEIKCTFDTLMAGTIEYEGDRTYPKVLVFTKFKRTLQLVIEFLQGQNIPFLVLIGTPAEKLQQVKLMQSTDIRVMLLLTSTDCAGLNLQFMTDCVFMHKLKNEAVEGQCIGRCQRIGQITGLRVHYLLYHYE